MVFDISGTVMDFGSQAPVEAFVGLFAQHGVAVTPADARAPMGLHKRDHLRAMLSNPYVQDRWLQIHGAPPGDSTIEELYREFPELQKAAIDRHLDLLPGVAETCAALRTRGIRIGSTTGFESGMMDTLRAAAASQGYQPDCWATPDQCGGGRPAPWMMYEISRQLNVYPLSTFVKVGDTPADIAEARNAGGWAVAVTKTGNEIGLSLDELNHLSEDEQAARLRDAREKFIALGAHYTVEGVSDLLPVVDEISSRITKGERP